MPSPLIESVKQLAAPPIEAAGYELVDLQWKREAGGMVCRVFIDRRDGVGTVTVEDCSVVSRELSVVLDVHDPLPGHYSLEVSSPGLERPLRTLAHFHRFIGSRARVRLVDGVTGRRNFTGPILATDAEVGTVTLDVDGGPAAIAIADLDHAQLVFQHVPPQRPGKGKRKSR